MSKPKAIDINSLNSESIKKLSFSDLASDAAARKDSAAYAFLNQVVAENAAKLPREQRRIQTIRKDYLEKFCGYKATQKPKKAKTKIEKQQELLASLAKFFD